MSTLILFLFSLISLSDIQSTLSFPDGFASEYQFENTNYLSTYSHLDFSSLWFVTKHNNVLGIIGDDNQRLRVNILSANQDVVDQSLYQIHGKTMVKENVCDFEGTIQIVEILLTSHLHYGVDDEYANKGIEAQGVLIAEYKLEEIKNQKASGIFEGHLYSKWYLDKSGIIKYDNIEIHSDGYFNNAFVGIWQSHRSSNKKISSWGDYRVPNSKRGFDSGVAEFVPSEKYHPYGWSNFYDAWVKGDRIAKQKELQEWW